MNLSTVLLLLGYLFLGILRASANNFGGANSFNLYALAKNDRIAVLDAMQSAKMKVLRISLVRVYAGAKGSSAIAVNDVETNEVGKYDDTILRLVDQLAVETHARGIKLSIVLHDRYSLGCWVTDAYVKKFNLPKSSDCKYEVPDSTAFYTNSRAIAAFDQRIKHILNFRSPHFGKPWHQLSEVIFAFEIQNEGMSYMNQVAPNWWCNRAKTIREVLGNSKIQISTGGGADIPSSAQDQLFTCREIQIVALHDYSSDPTYLAAQVDAAKAKAYRSGKRLIFGEFGAFGDQKQLRLQRITSILEKTGVPWQVWSVAKPGKGSSDFEVWTNEPSWKTLKSASLSTSQHGGAFGWPEIK